MTIVMPTFNEAGNISDLIKDCAAADRPTGASAIEVIVVDEDSRAR